MYALSLLIDIPGNYLLERRSALESLSAAAVEARYPGSAISHEKALRAFETASDVRAYCQSLLRGADSDEA